jgi:hypothetical protein
MATILNKQPVQSSKFDKFWLTSLNVVFPSNTTSGIVIVKLQPYDGTHIITSNARVYSHTNFDDPTFNRDILDLTQLITIESERLFPECIGLTNFKVLSNDPKKSTTAFFVYSDGSSRIIENCFAFAKEDPVFGTKIDILLKLIAKSAALPVIN